MTKSSSGDRRWLAGILLAIPGAISVLVTRALREDSWIEFAGVAVYSIGWALLTFGVLYLLSKRAQISPEGMEAFEEGTVGWASARLTITLPDRHSVSPRWSPVFHREGDEWRCVQTHASIGPAPTRSGGSTRVSASTSRPTAFLCPPRMTTS